MAGTALILGNTSPINPVAGFDADEIGDFCACDFRCEFEENVFANDLGNGITNDFTDFPFRKIANSDTVEIKLYRYKVLVATITDDTYGTYYDGFDNQPNYIGWYADWTKIFNAFSGGLYQVKTTLNILGQESIVESRLFRLNYYDAKLAHQTVKIETVQTGKIVNSEFDYTDLLEGGWKSSIRLKGEFGKMQPEMERDIYLDSSYREVQNRDVVNKKYELKCEIVPTSLFTRVTGGDFLANEIFISSYNLFDDQKYKQYPVTVDSYDSVDYKDYGFMNFSILFKDRKQDTIKRNF